jgi:hypothetical protein
MVMQRSNVAPKTIKVETVRPWLNPVLEMNGTTPMGVKDRVIVAVGEVVEVATDVALGLMHSGKAIEAAPDAKIGPPKSSKSAKSVDPPAQ